MECNPHLAQVTIIHSMGHPQAPGAGGQPSFRVAAARLLALAQEAGDVRRDVSAEELGEMLGMLYVQAVAAWLKQPGAAPLTVRLERAGGKGWNLGRLKRYGFPVPAGGVLVADAYEQFRAAPSGQLPAEVVEAVGRFLSRSGAAASFAGIHQPDHHLRSPGPRGGGGQRGRQPGGGHPSDRRVRTGSG